jgi:predicted nucleotidyltransferase
LLGVLYGHAGEAFYLRELIPAARVGQGAVQREVKRLSNVDIIQRSVRGREVHYRASRDYPIFAELKSLVLKTPGVGDVLRTALAPVERRIQVAFVFGSFAKGEQNERSDVDVRVVCDASFAEVVAQEAGQMAALARSLRAAVERWIKANRPNLL